MRAPLVPADVAVDKAVAHAGFAALSAAIQGGGGGTQQCIRLYPNDKVALALLMVRAATTGATTTVPGWASEIVSTAIGEWLGSLAPASAAAQLMTLGLTVPLDQNLDSVRDRERLVGVLSRAQMRRLP